MDVKPTVNDWRKGHIRNMNEPVKNDKGKEKGEV